MKKAIIIKMWKSEMENKCFMTHNKYDFEVTVEIGETLYENLLTLYDWHDVGFNRKQMVIVPR